MSLLNQVGIIAAFISISLVNVYAQDSSLVEPAKETVEIKCTEEGYFGHPTDCHKFYRCVDFQGDGKSFTVFHFECGEGTWWDESITTCNYAGAQSPEPPCARYTK
jgi:hypothetical protein